MAADRLNIPPEELRHLLLPQVTPDNPEPLLRGLPAFPGWAHGPLGLDQTAPPGSVMALLAPRPSDLGSILRGCALLTADPSAGILCPGWELPGAGQVPFELEEGCLVSGSLRLRPGDPLLVDGSRGWVFRGGPAPRQPGSLPEELGQSLRALEEGCPVQVLANADTQQDWLQARRMGARGVGLCRTEWAMGPVGTSFLELLLTGEEVDPEPLIKDLGSHLRALFRAAAGRPVTVRLLDAPLHQFLPGGRALAEANPMLGLRWCRTGLRYPSLYRAQLQAFFQAARRVETQLSILVPGPCLVQEVEAVAGWARELSEGVPYRLGAMLELPRACLLADHLARVCDFLAFGTNDLTQAVLGMSREDARFSVLPSYLEQGLLKHDPFLRLDLEGVGELMLKASRRARLARPGIPIGVCGDHAGVPANIPFLLRSGVSYVSCYPTQVPSIRLAVAQGWAALRAGGGHPATGSET